MRAGTATWLWIAQRGSAAVLGLTVLVHLVTMVIAIQGGLSHAEILGRVAGSVGWLLFYGTFVLACAIHAPIGIRTILREMTAVPGEVIDWLAAGLAIALLALGLRAAWVLYTVEVPA